MISLRRDIGRLLRAVADQIDPPTPQTFTLILEPDYVRDLVAEIAARN